MTAEERVKAAIAAIRSLQVRYIHESIQPEDDDREWVAVAMPDIGNLLNILEGDV